MNSFTRTTWDAARVVGGAVSAPALGVLCGLFPSAGHAGVPAEFFNEFDWAPTQPVPGPTNFEVVFAGNVTGQIPPQNQNDANTDPFPNPNPITTTYDCTSNTTTVTFSGGALVPGQRYHFGLNQGFAPTPPLHILSKTWTYTGTAASSLPPSALPIVTVAAPAPQSQTGPFQYAVVYLEAAFQPGGQTYGSWYEVPYTPDGSGQPVLTYSNFGGQPLYISNTGIQFGLSVPTDPDCQTNPNCTENGMLLDALDFAQTPPPGQPGSQFVPITSPPPPVLMPKFGHAPARPPGCVIEGEINGGGSTLAQFDYIAEFTTYNATAPAGEATFGQYWESGSGVGQLAFLNDDLSCDINKVTGANGGACGGNAGVAGNIVQYGASDATLNSTQIATWATSSFGQFSAGNLIQLPSMGVGIAIPVNDTNITASGQVTLSDNDLCGIFSGLTTDFSQITDSATAPAAGQFKLVYRSDGSGTTFLLTDHLSAVCTAGNTKAGVSFTATTNFASLFSGLGGIAAVIPNAVAETGSIGVADYMAGLSNGAVPQAIGYLSPDFTTVDPNSFATLSNGEPSTLVVAALFNGGKAQLPSTTGISAALAHATRGANLTPPTNAEQGANPVLWVPLIQTASEGYPIVGYTTFDFAQCYSDETVTKSLLAFLKDHYAAAGSYATDQKLNGFVPVANSGAAKFLTTIKASILANKSGWNTDIGDTTACQGVSGR
jgi:ABC-type phosphate transport system substrate-binding protein